MAEAPQRKLPLWIVAKTRMNNGFCYMGFAEGVFYRPIYRTQENMCQWDPDKRLEVGWCYAFDVRRYPWERDRVLEMPRTMNPHAREDTLVGSVPLKIRRSEVPLYELLRPVAKSKIQDVFGGLDCRNDDSEEGTDWIGFDERTYWTGSEGGTEWIGFEEGTDCPSVGVLRCTRKQFKIREEVDIEKRKTKQRLFLCDEGYDLPITCPPITRSGNEGGDQEVLILLGLGRPWDNDGKYSTARCYVLVLGIFYEKEASCKAGGSEIPHKSAKQDAVRNPADSDEDADNGRASAEPARKKRRQ